MFSFVRRSFPYGRSSSSQIEFPSHLLSSYYHLLLIGPRPGNPSHHYSRSRIPGSFSPPFDLLLVNLFLTPIASFVFSFLNTKKFIQLLLQLTTVGTVCFLGTISLFDLTATQPCSLFGGLALALVVFWTLLHSKGQPSFILGIPISRLWILLISTLTVVYTPLFTGDWAKLAMIISMSLSAYLWGIGRWRLRSHIEALEGFERLVDKCYRFF